MDDIENSSVGRIVDNAKAVKEITVLDVEGVCRRASIELYRPNCERERVGYRWARRPEGTITPEGATLQGWHSSAYVASFGREAPCPAFL